MGFFADSDSIEEQVFLTVVKELLNKPELAPRFGRATIGRRTSGCSIYMVPAADAKWQHNGSAVTPLVVHEFRLPVSAADPLLEEHWRKLQPLPPPGGALASPPPPEVAWQHILEEKSLELHWMLREAALPSPALPLAACVPQAGIRGSAPIP